MFSWEFANFVKQQKQPPEVFRKKGVHKNFTIFTRQHLCWSLFGVFGVNFIKKKTPTQIFSCEYYEIFKKIYFKEPVGTTAS